MAKHYGLESECFDKYLHLVMIFFVLVMPAWAALDQRKNKKMIDNESACGSCDGSCFGGHCLFDVTDDAASPVPQQFNADLRPGSLHPKFENPGITENQKTQRSLLALQAQATVPAPGLLPIADLLRSSKGEQQALQGDVAFLSTEASGLRAQLRADEQELQQVRSEKMQLQEQLRKWAIGLAHITAREAHMLELVGVSRNVSESSTSTLWDVIEGEFGFLLGTLSSRVRDTTATLQAIVFILTLVIVLALAYKFRARILFLLFETEEVKLSWQDVVWGALSCCHLCWPLEPLGRAIGLAYQQVEISEIQLGHLLVGGDVYVCVDIGTNPLLNTRTINQSDGVFLRFRETFKVNVRKTDGPCVFKVIDQDVLMSDQIAQLEINAWEFVNLARKGSSDANSGYYRFDLQHRQRRMKQQVMKGPGGLRPYIAMRLREVTSLKPPSGFAGDLMAKQSQKDFLQTLNSQPGTTHFTLDPNTNELKLP